MVGEKGSSESGHYGHTGLPGVWGGSRPTGTAEPKKPPTDNGGEGALSEDSRMLALWDDEEFVRAMDNVGFVERGRTAEQYAIDSFCEGVGLSKDEFVYMFALPGLRTEIDIEDGIKYGSGLVVITWFTKDGERVARAEREFINSETCENLYFSLDRKYQNADVGASLYARQRYILRKAEYSEITLHADISIGRYAWAKQGFDYVSYHSASQRERRDKLRDWLGHVNLQTEALVHSEEIDKLLTPHDFATFSIPKVKINGSQIRNVAVKDDYVMHVGKAYMLDQGRYGHGEWYGEYDLWQ